MKVLLAILSCHRDRKLGYDQACRDTWLKGADVDHRFFVGGPLTGTWLTDEVHVEADDSYEGLPLKTRAICEWALGRGYDYLFKCDTDTYVHVPRLLASRYWRTDYRGFYRGDPLAGGYASGGSGYWLSRAAMGIIANHDMTRDYLHHEKWRGYWNGEDKQVGEALLEAGIKCRWDFRYRLDMELPAGSNDYITAHPVIERLRGKAMHDAHRRVTASFGKETT
jgi:hypothetical protein